MTNFARLLGVLQAAEVRYIVIGGVAGIGHGAARFTQDVDIVYERSEENLRSLAKALQPFSPYPRGAPPGLPFRWDAETLCRGLNFTLMTQLGAVDLFGEIVGGGGYDQLINRTVSVTLFGQTQRVLDLPTLIRVKRAAGRPKDHEAIAELELLLEERDRLPSRGNDLTA